jgi:hypothetical protein
MLLVSAFSFYLKTFRFLNFLVLETFLCQELILSSMIIKLGPKRAATKGLCHVQMRENHVRENVERHFVTINHVGGKVNLADLFTKEMEDTGQFVILLSYAI